MSIFITKNFKFSEFACPCCNNCRPFDPRLIYLLQLLRDKIKKPIYITSGLRCKKYNRKIDGYIHSPHVPHYVTIKGKKRLIGCRAVDVHAKNMTIFELFWIAVDIGFSRIGIYPDNHFLHLDVLRPVPSRAWVKFKKRKPKYFKTWKEAIEFANKKSK